MENNTEDHVDNDINSYDNSVLEDRIMNIIIKIRQGRSRPCYQNILNYVNRGDIKVEMETLKNILNDLVERNVLKIKGDNDKESFYIVDSEDVAKSSEETNGTGHVEKEFPSTSAEHLIQEKFHETLINMIKVD